jgi:capsular exopolysaccharide synthesis family protein
MEPYINTKETTLRDYLRVVFRHKAVIFITFITVMATVYILLELKTPIYQAQVKMLVVGKKPTAAPYYRELRSPIGGTQSAIVMSSPVIERAVKALGLYQRPLDYEKNFCSSIKALLVDFRVKRYNTKLEDLKPKEKQVVLFRMAVQALKENLIVGTRETMLLITAKDFSPVGAAIIANVVSRSYVLYDLEQQMAELQLKYGEKHFAVKQLKDIFDKMNKNLIGEQLSDVDAIGPASVKILEQARVPSEPEGRPKFIKLILAFVMGIFLGLILAFGLEYLDQTFKSPQEVKTALNLPYLGSIPKKKFRDYLIIRDRKRMTPYMQAYQNLADQLHLLIKDGNLKTILIAAAMPQEGATTIIANLGAYFSHKARRKVLIIDANLRTPSMHKIFLNGTYSTANKTQTGLSSVLEGKTTFEEAVHESDSNLSILPAGETTLNPITLLDSPRMADVLKTAKERYEVVFVDYANLKDFKDAAMLSSYLDGIVLVVNEGRTRRLIVKAAIAPLQQKKANLIGVILNYRKHVIPKMIYKRV